MDDSRDDYEDLVDRAWEMALSQGIRQFGSMSVRVPSFKGTRTVYYGTESSTQYLDVLVFSHPLTEYRGGWVMLDMDTSSPTYRNFLLCLRDSPNPPDYYPLSSVREVKNPRIVQIQLNLLRSLGSGGTSPGPSPNSGANLMSSWAQFSSATAGSTSTLITIVSPPLGYKLRGFAAHGTGDGYFFIQIDNLTILSGRTRSTSPMLTILLPAGIVVNPTSTLALKVTNESNSTADYEATLLGE